MILNGNKKVQQVIEYFLFAIFFLSLMAITVQATAGSIELRPNSSFDNVGETENPELAYDGDYGSYATVNAIANADPSITYIWGSISDSYDNVLLDVRLFSKNFKNDKWGIKYSLDGGNTWQILKEISSENTVSSINIKENIGPLSSSSNVQLVVYTDSKGGLDKGIVNIYETFLEATPSTPVPLSLKQSSFRFFESIGPDGFYSINSGVSGVDEAKAIATDGVYIYVAGFEPGGWRIEKRRLTDGTLMKSVTNDCGGEPYAISVSDGDIFIVGDDYSAGNYQWRVEKRKTGDLSLDQNFAVGGVVFSNPSDSNDTAYGFVIIDDNIYIAGSDRSNGSDDSQWRLEVRGVTDGSLIGGDDAIILSNPSNDNDIPFAISTDGNNLYVGGYDRINKISTRPGKNKKATSNAQWRLEKRSLGNLSQVISLVQVNPTDNSDSIISMATDSDSIYLAGYQEEGFFDTAWRIEKRNLSDLGLNENFGDHGVLTNDFGYNDSPESIALDKDYIYIAGFSADLGGGGDTAWRIEKLNKVTGGEVYSIVNDIYDENNDRAYGIAIDGDFMYIVGYQQPDLADWRIEKRDIESGYLLTPLSDQNTIAYLSPGQPFRLKMLVHAEGNSLPENGGQFKLQVAIKTSTDCADSTYQDLGSISDIIFNAILGSDGEPAIKTEEDPYTEGAVTRYQSYEESNPFTNIVSDISAGENGLWDFSLIAKSPGQYCFRIVKNDGSDMELNDYLFYPEISVSIP